MEDKQKKLMIIIICGLLCIIGLMAIGKDEQEVAEQPVQQEQTTEEQPVVEEEEPVEDEYLTEKDIVKETSEKDQMTLAKTILDEMAKESFGRDGYKILSEGNALMLCVDIDKSEVVYASSSEWENLRDTIAEVSSQVQDRMEDIGCGDINVALSVADIDRDEVFLMASYGVILYDVFE